MNVSYFPGCTLHGTAREYGESTEAVAKTLGIELQELPDWNCCGASSAHATSEILATALPARNVLIADRVGLELVVPCAACYQRLKVAEKELLSGKGIVGIAEKYTGRIHIKHATDFFWEDVGEEVIREKIKKPLTGLHPVCYYGCLIVRPPKVTDAKNHEDPQSLDNLMQTLGAEARNWSYKTECCGAGHTLTRPDIAQKMVRRLLDMAEEAGADCIVNGCPLCQSNLDLSQHEMVLASGKKYHTPILLFTELMGVAFGEPTAEKWLSRHMVDPRPLLREKKLI